MVQKKPHHLQEQNDANFDEEKHLDVEKQHQALPIAPEGEQINEYNRIINGSNIDEEVTAEPSHQPLSMKTGTAKTSEEEINTPLSNQPSPSMQKQEPKPVIINITKSQTTKAPIDEEPNA